MPITLLYAGLLGLWFLVLSVRVIAGRRSGKVNLGDGGSESLLRRIRAHGNFAEYVPFILLLMAALESTGVQGWLLHFVGVPLLIGRLLHGYAFSFTAQFMLGRLVGMMLTLTALSIAVMLCLWRALAV